MTHIVKHADQAFFGSEHGNLAINCGEKMEISLHHSQSLFIAKYLGIVNINSKRTRYHETDRLSRR